MSINNELPELVKAEVISQETADRIQEYYQVKRGQSTNRLFIVFGVLGAILVGLGIILILAHNWDEFSRITKTSLAFLPLIIGQLLCGFVLLKRPDNKGWSESASVFLFISIGASISLVSQIYHIPGDISSFMVTWMLLGLPLIYLMKSSSTALLYIVGISYYATQMGYWTYPTSQPYLYWALLFLIAPFYYQLSKKTPKGNFMIALNWLVPLSMIIVLGTLAKKNEEIMMIAYISLFGLFYLVGRLKFFTQQKARNSGYKAIGSLGTIVLLLILSFDIFWEHLRGENVQFNEVVLSPEFLATVIITSLTGVFFYFHQRDKALNEIKPTAWVFMLFIVTFMIGLQFPVSVVLINIFVLVIGVITIREGANQDHLGVLNYGLLIITALVICRFFDTDLSFVLRGLMFVLVGAGFFAMNYKMLKKRRENGQ